MKKHLKRNPLEFGTLAISFIAIILSLISINKEPKRHSDILTSETVAGMYSELANMTKIQAEHPLQSHLFINHAGYNEMVKMIKARNINPDPKQVLVERAIANRIFNHFAQVVFSYEQARTSGNLHRIKLTNRIRSYYASHLLKNPRLLWYWDKNGGNLSAMQNFHTRKYYESILSKRQISYFNLKIDSKGPFDR